MPGGRHEHMQAWSPEEDLIIIDSVKLHGHQWRLIVKELPGRSVSSTRNRFNRIEKGRQMKESGLRGRNLCHACWQPKKGHICTAKIDGGPHVVKRSVVVKPRQPIVVAPPMADAAVYRSLAPEAAPATGWTKPTVAKKSSSMLSVLGGEDLSAIFGDWAKKDAADAGSEPPLLPAPAPPAPPAHDQLDLDSNFAPAALVRMASGGEAAEAGWQPPTLSRSLSSFFRGHSFLLGDTGAGSGSSDAERSQSSQSSDASSEMSASPSFTPSASPDL
jgi:hypothetical protein